MSNVLVEKIKKVPVEIQAADALRDAITGGVIAPGQRITESQLAEQFGLSRSSVRAALNQLAKEGLTSLIPYTGWTIATLSSQDVWELYTLRSSVERLAAQLVAESITDEKKARLQAALQLLKEACARSNPVEIAEADFSLHKTIIDLTGHGRLHAQYELIERQIRMYIRSSDALIEDSAAILSQHEPIVHAIMDGNVEEAGLLSERHNLSEGKKLTSYMASLQGNSSEPALRESRGTWRLRNQSPKPKSSGAKATRSE